MPYTKVDMLALRRAIESSWRPDSAYHYVVEEGNPARGQCYVTARVIQYYFPDAEIVEGDIQTGKAIEKHFWALFDVESQNIHLDLTWQQFPLGSYVVAWRIRDRTTLHDSQETTDRVQRLLDRVQQQLGEL